MDNTLYTSTITGTGKFGINALIYLRQKPITDTCLVFPGTIAPEQNRRWFGKTEDPDASRTEVIFFIADLSETDNFDTLEQYESSFSGATVFKIAVVVMPGASQQSNKAQATVAHLQKISDTVILLNREITPESFVKSTEEAVYQVISCMNNISTGEPMEVNVDFEDLKTVLECRTAMVGVGEAGGTDRAMAATRQALSAPFEQNIYGSERILLSITSGPDAELEMVELTDITDYIQNTAGEQAEVIFGHGIEDSLAARIRVVIMAAIPEIVPA